MVQDRRVALIRMQRIEQAERLASAVQIGQVDLVERRNDRVMEPQRVIRPVDAEWRLYDRNVYVELDAHGIADVKVCPRRDLQLLPLIHQRELLVDVRHT